VKVHLYAFGKLKTPGLRDAADHYSRLARTWLTLEEFELKPLPVPDKSPENRIQIQEKEGLLLLDKIKSRTPSPRGVIYLLDETGKPRSTQEWAKELRTWETEGYPTVSFCIGSSLGFSPEVRRRAKSSFSLGPQTLSHELARVVLLEQIYRACSVLRGHPYHNEGS
jgi:23S rRNA (pseudouridine1915-N3)-methyltransferase